MANHGISDNVSSFVQEIKKYLEIRLDLVKLDITERLAKIFSALVMVFALSSLLLLFVFFFSLAAAFYIGELLHSQALGFLCIAGVFLLKAILIYTMRNWLITRPAIKFCIRMLFRNEKK